MSSKTSSRSTLTTVPSTMSPSLKYLMVSSIAARKASCDPMSLTATWGVGLASVLLVMCWLTPADREVGLGRAEPGSPSPGLSGVNWICLADLAGHSQPVGQPRPCLAMAGLHQNTAQRSGYERSASGSIAALDRHVIVTRSGRAAQCPASAQLRPVPTDT